MPFCAQCLIPQRLKHYVDLLSVLVKFYFGVKTVVGPRKLLRFTYHHTVVQVIFLF